MNWLGGGEERRKTGKKPRMTREHWKFNRFHLIFLSTAESIFNKLTEIHFNEGSDVELHDRAKPSELLFTDIDILKNVQFSLEPRQMEKIQLITNQLSILFAVPWYVMPR